MVLQSSLPNTRFIPLKLMLFSNYQHNVSFITIHWRSCIIQWLFGVLMTGWLFKPSTMPVFNWGIAHGLTFFAEAFLRPTSFPAHTSGEPLELLITIHNVSSAAFYWRSSCIICTATICELLSPIRFCLLCSVLVGSVTTFYWRSSDIIYTCYFRITDECAMLVLATQASFRIIKKYITTVQCQSLLHSSMFQYSTAIWVIYCSFWRQVQGHAIVRSVSILFTLALVVHRCHFWGFSNGIYSDQQRPPPGWEKLAFLKNGEGISSWP